MRAVCLVIGAGAGIGGNVARRFAREGYHAHLCRRSDQHSLNRLVETIRSVPTTHQIGVRDHV
jgi:NAD(P)-dependent dehydrogenase (short-subunit alcohol dehydrogenase family)